VALGARQKALTTIVVPGYPHDPIPQAIVSQSEMGATSDLCRFSCWRAYGAGIIAPNW
jgi:hypothetical protein